MKISNHKLITVVSETVSIGLIPALIELAALRTGVKVGYNVAYTLKKASEAQEIINTLKKPLELRYAKEKKQVDKEWTELMLSESEFEARPITLSDLEGILDSDKITPTLILNLGDFITE